MQPNASFNPSSLAPGAWLATQHAVESIPVSFTYLPEAALACIAISDSVSPADLGCSKDLPRFLAAITLLQDRGFPIQRIQRPNRWGWSDKREVGYGPRIWVAYAATDRMLLLDPLKRWARSWLQSRAPRG